MLDDFLILNRDAIIARTQERGARESSPRLGGMEIANGLPVFLDQLGVAIRLARSTAVIDHDAIGMSAGRHGHELLRRGLSIAQVVHVYGHACQSITELAIQLETPISGHEFQTLNLCLDDAIAGAVTAYSQQRELRLVNQGSERLGILAHEMRNLLHVATLSFESIKSGQVAVGGSTGLVHSRALLGLNNLIDRSLAEVRLDAGIEHRESISVAEFVEEAEIGGILLASGRDLSFTVSPVDRTAMIEGDRQMLAAAIANLIQNAFKFSHRGANILLTTRVTDDRVFFEVEDECGGLPSGGAEELFRPFEQRAEDRTGVGLGLSICLRTAEANGGKIDVRDLPGKGCVFTLELPRMSLAAPMAH